MRKNHVVVIGSGFGGVITARILNRLGALVTLVDAARHPRFAIGESSTPIADQLLRLIGSRYGFEDLVSMSCYGRWKSASPDVTCGKKRGFSYFDHRATRNTNRGATTEGFEGERSLLVAASPTDDASDTHWFRQEVDQALVTEACREGVELLEETRVTDLSRRADNCLDVKLSAGTNIVADFVVDASGNATTASLLQQPDLTHRLRTRTKTAYSHFSNVESFSSYFDSIHDDRRATWPFDADDAAQHHLIDEGWVWMLRLENGITSVGATSANHSVSA
ncbi:MAG: FAD-dependent oxidoreductase, partial [Planctomycetota bacterium]